MPERFNIPINYRNEQKEYQVTIVRLIYSYQLHIIVDEQTLVFEPDENREFRLIKMQWQNEDDIRKVDVDLIETIVATLNTLYSSN